MAPPRVVQESADEMVSYFWPQIERWADNRMGYLSEYNIPEELARAIAVSLSMFESWCMTKHCPECVANHQMMKKAANLMNAALAKMDNDENE